MDINSVMNPGERARLDTQVETFNKSLSSTTPQEGMDKDDFMKILITQLQHQDPTKPMEDREFIAQMAQFSTLEQMTNMSAGFSSLAGKLSSSRALDMLGKTVEVQAGDQMITGPVEAVTTGDNPQLLVQGSYFDLNDINKVTD